MIPGNALIDDDKLSELQVELERQARRNGRMSFAHDLALWLNENRWRVPVDVRSDLAEWLMREIV